MIPIPPFTTPAIITVLIILVFMSLIVVGRAPRLPWSEILGRIWKR